MKRLLSVLLLALSIISFVGCETAVKPADKPTESESSTPVDKTETIAEDCVEDYVYSEIEYELNYYGSFLLTGETDQGETKKAPSRMPQLKIDSADAQSINEDIHKNYDDFFNNVNESSERPYARIDYLAYLNDDILSLVIESRSIDTPNSHFNVYNIDVKTGSQLNKEELVELSGLALADANDLVCAEIEKKFDVDFNMEGQEEYLKTAHDNSISDENLARADYYYNENGQLVATYRYYWIAGAADYGDLVLLDAHKK